MATVHVSPVTDLIDHDLENGDACMCGPMTQPVKHDDGSVSWVVVHSSLDSRELTEEAH